jgi:hypothetical protein
MVSTKGPICVVLSLNLLVLPGCVSISALKYLYESIGMGVRQRTEHRCCGGRFARSLSTTTAKSDIYAFFFDQKGLMAGIGIRGSKITKIEK